eukprot:TRINITY_DN1420_c0_g1_i1.p1 TRINITY_DN1420_c0_g1~~TRINITY_DN1420_c0_g1_i1.p1  ORF type:complete len:189 (-),score=41.46 TRINITY_DN1420_c0_g1_i1:139-705(-)
MVLPAAIERFLPFTPTALGGMCSIFVLGSLGADIWSVVDCGSEVEFGWKESHTNPSFEYSNCTPNSVFDCDTLQGGGQAALAFGILSLFILLAGAATSFLGFIRGNGGMQKNTTIMYAVATLFVLISFASWTANSHSELKDAYDYGFCDVKLGDSTNLMIATFVFMLINTSVTAYLWKKGGSGDGSAV